MNFLIGRADLLHAAVCRAQRAMGGGWTGWRAHRQSGALTSEALFCALGSSRSGASRFTCRTVLRRAAVTAVSETTSRLAVAPSSHNLSLWCRRRTTSTSRPPLIRGPKLTATPIPTLVSADWPLRCLETRSHAQRLTSFGLQLIIFLFFLTCAHTRPAVIGSFSLLWSFRCC